MRLPWPVDQAHDKSDLEQLVIRSNLLGADPSIVNWKGGNTSAKVVEQDHTGRLLRVLWIKGSGSDLRTATRRDFVGLRLDEITPLVGRNKMTDEEMVDYLLQCTLHPTFPRPSIETLLHAFLPFAHIDHTHPDGVLAFCTAQNGEHLVREAFGEDAIWIPYQRPGFALSKAVYLAVSKNPEAKAVFLAKHGLVTWGETSQACYESTIATIERAEDFVMKRAKGRSPFGELKVQPIERSHRRAILFQVLPVLRGAVSKEKRVILHVDDTEPVLDFVGRTLSEETSQVGAVCPDHLVHTKYIPLFVSFDPNSEEAEVLLRRVRAACEAYADRYRHYVEASRHPSDPVGDPYPRIVLIPGLGMIAAGKDKEIARQTAGLYQRAIAVMAGASSMSQFTPLTPKEAYDVEYWPLELYKLTLARPEGELSRHIALVTGGAGGIGRAIASALAREGAHIALVDIDREGAFEVARELCDLYGEGRVISLFADVRDEESLKRAFEEAVLNFGGMDIVVANAGIARAGSVEGTTLEDWDSLFQVLARGYFLTAREAFKVMREQGLGGSVIFVTSKNALLATRGAAAYNAAKAAAAHLARSLAEDGGPYGIRVNCVAPDAVLRGSRIWSSQWRQERAITYGISPDELEAFYRNRTTLKVNVYPEDVAEAVLFFASNRSRKTTGCTLTVDGGVPGAYPR